MCTYLLIIGNEREGLSMKEGIQEGNFEAHEQENQAEQYGQLICYDDQTGRHQQELPRPVPKALAMLRQ